MSTLDTITTHSKKILNRAGHIVDSAFSVFPKKVATTTERVFSANTANQISDSIQDVKNNFASLFQNIVEEDTINLATEDVACGIIANLAYCDPFSRDKEVDTYKLIEEYNKIEYCLYRDDKAQKYILGYRGTEFRDSRDYISDLNIIIGTHEFDERFQHGLKVYEEIAEKYPDDIKIITGHSLGGTICYMIAQKKDPDRTVVFNPGSSANPTFIMMMKDTQTQEPRTKRIFTYRILGDIVSTLSVIGYTRTFRKASVNPADLHAAINFLPAGYTLPPENK